MHDAPERKTFAVFAQPKNKKLIAGLEKSGANLVKITPARLTAVEDSGLAGALEKFNQYDWLVFADVYAVEFFLVFAEERNFDLYNLDDVHVCALGEAVAERLRLAQIHTDVVPTVITTEKIVDSIAEYIFEESGFDGKKFLLLKESNDFFEFSAALENKNAEVSEMPVYVAEFEQPVETAKVKALIKGGAVDEMLFAAPEEWLQFRFLFRRESITNLTREMKISAADETTRQTLGENQISAALFFHSSGK